MPVLKNRAYVSTGTTGTGAITLGSPVSGYQSFADAGVSNGNSVRYTIEDGTNWEIGAGTYTASGTTLSRSPIDSSSSGSAINLSGSARVFITAAAEDILQPSNNLSDLANASTSRTNLGVAIGSNVQAYDADLTALGGLAKADGNIIVGNGSTWVAENGATARTSLGLAIGTNVQAYSTVLQNTTASFLTADKTKLDYITVTQAVNLDQMETDIAALENGMVYKGDWNAGSGSFPGGGSAQTGWFYYVSGAGTVNGVTFAVGDNVVATTDNASTTTYAGNWSKHDQTDAVQAVVGLTGSISKSSLLSALNVEDGADVTDAGNVNPLVDAHINVSSASSGQYLNWNGSDYAWGSIDTSTLMPKAGGTFSGAVTFTDAVTLDGSIGGRDVVWDRPNNSLIFNDNAKAKFGTGQDLEIFHGSDSSYIDEVGGGSLFIRTNGPNVFIGKYTGSEYMAVFTPDGAVSLRYDNATKFETTSSGINVTGTVTDDGATHDGDVTFTGASYNAVWDKSDNALEFADNAKAKFGTGGDLEIYHSGSDSFIKDVGDGALNVYSNAVDFFNAAGSERTARFIGGGSNILFNAGAIKLQTNATGIDVTGVITDDGATHDGDVTFTGTSYNAVWDKSQNSLEFADNAKATFGDSRDLQIYHDGNSVIRDDGGGDLELRGSNTISLMNAAGTEYKLRAYTDGAVNLYYDNAVKVATTSSGISVTGSVVATTHESSGALTLKSASGSDLTINHGDRLNLAYQGLQYGEIYRSSGFNIENKEQDADIIFKGNDGGSTITALTLDMSDAGTATFNHDAKFADNGKATFGAGADGSIYSDGNNFIIDGTTTGIYQTLIQGTTGVKLRNNGGSGGYADGLIVDGANSASTRVRAQYGTTTRLETTSSGVTVTGTVAATAVTGDGSGLTNLPAAAASGVFYENDTNVSSNYTITSGKNAMSAGPITIDSGVTVTVPSGSAWTVVA